MAETQLNLFVGSNSLFESRSSIKEITRETIEVELGILSAETWPNRYKLHKYWGRKPANVVSKYIDFFSKPGDVILDPFAGSGVTIVEGARLERTSIGFDLNPLAVKLSGAMLAPPSISAFDAAAKTVLEKVDAKASYLFNTTCDHCSKKATVRSVGYVGETMNEVRYRCNHCGRSSTHIATAQDIALAQQQVPAIEDAPDGDILFGWEMQKLKRRGLKRWSELFTPRNFFAAAELRKAILEVEDSSCRNWLLLSLTASLAQFTRMIADFSGAAGGPSWKINCYWLPEKWQELNPLWYFENRISKSRDSIRDLVANGAPFQRGSVANNDSREMPLPDESVDYIFTDPPYGGEGIQYGELSVLWCLWIGEQQNLEAEIAFNPFRKLDQEHYATGMEGVFSECFRVLKPGKWLTVTFANKDPIVWDALMSSCRRAGFSLVTAAPMKRSAPSLTETTMHKAPKADLVLTFKKPADGEPTPRLCEEAQPYSINSSVERIVAAMENKKLSITAHDVFDRVTVDWFSWFYESGERPGAIQPTLQNIEAALIDVGITNNQVAGPTTYRDNRIILASQ